MTVEQLIALFDEIKAALDHAAFYMLPSGDIAAIKRMAERVEQLSYTLGKPAPPPPPPCQSKIERDKENARIRESLEPQYLRAFDSLDKLVLLTTPEVLLKAYARVDETYHAKELFETHDDPEWAEWDNQEWQRVFDEYEAAEAEVARLEQLWEEGKLS